MTLWDLFTVAFQRKLLTICCVLLTGLAVAWVSHTQPVYLSQVNVVLLRPASVPLNAYTNTSQSLIDMAGVVARAVQGGDGSAQTVSDGVTLAGEGIRDGYAVQQPNGGGQWQYRFDQPFLDIQAVGSTASEARRQMTLALADVRATLDRVQDDQGVSAANRVRVNLNPLEPQLYAAAGSHIRAVGATAVLGILITLALMGALGPKSQLYVGGSRAGRVPERPRAGARDRVPSGV
jgi:hypothetical protein